MNSIGEIKNKLLPYYAVHKDGLIAAFFPPFRFLSNFYGLKNGVCLDELYFPSTENAYQAAKYPIEERYKFVDIKPAEAMRLGRMSPTLNKKVWNKIKYDIMFNLVRQKFFNNEDLKEMLLLTDGYILEERNSWKDIYWGTNEKGEGENNLGKILMIVRDELKDKMEIKVFPQKPK